MARQSRTQTIQVNGAPVTSLTTTTTPVVPVKTEAELLRELDLERQLAEAKAENQRLKEQAERRNKAGNLSLRISEKGALSVYGLGRFPVTLYREQWEKLLAIADEIRAFIAMNSARLKSKGE